MNFFERYQRQRQAAAVLVALLQLTPARAGDWPVFKRDVTRAGHAREQAYPSLSVSWVYDNIQGEVRSSPVVANGRVFIGGRDGGVWAFHPDTGQILWQYSTDGYVDASPAAANGYVYVPSCDGRLYAFAETDGTEPLWTYGTGSQDMSSPAVYQERVYWATGYPNRQLLAVHARSGELVWQADLSINSLSSPALEDGVLAVGVNNGTIRAFNASDGSPQWAYQTTGRIEFSSLAGDGQGYFYAVAGGDDPHLYAFNARTGQLKTGYPVSLVDISPMGYGKPATETSSVVVADGKVYVAMTGKTGPSTVTLQLFCRNTADGTQAWAPQNLGSAPEGLGYASTPAIANDVLYIGSGDGKLYMFNAVDGTSLGSIALGSAIVSSPAVANGKVFVGTLAGHVYALQAERVAAISSPADGAVVGGTVNISGVVANPAFENYKVEYGVGAAPDTWTAIGEVHTAAVPTNGVLESWDTSALTPQTYTVRLSVAASGAGAASAKSYVTLAIDASYARQYIVAAAGGTLAANDGTGLAVAAASLNQSDFITLSKPGGVPSGTVPESAAATNVVRQVAFDSPLTLFLTPASLTVPYQDADVLGLDTAQLRLFYLDGASWKLLENSSVNTSSKTVTGLISQPGYYRILENRLVGTDQDFVYISPDGAEVHVTKGTFSQPDSVTVTKHTAGEYITAQTPANAQAMPAAWEFKTGKPDTTFAKLVTIKVPYDPSLLGTTPETRLRMYLWYPSEKIWKIVNGSTVEPALRKVTVQVSHFSVYRAMAYLATGVLLEKDKVYTYPNPARGDTVTFKTALGDDAVLTIDVYNVAGERVARLTNSGTAGNVVETVWDVRDVASGVYVYRVEAKGLAGGKADVTKKLAILH